MNSIPKSNEPGPVQNFSYTSTKIKVKIPILSESPDNKTTQAALNAFSENVLFPPLPSLPKNLAQSENLSTEQSKSPINSTKELHPDQLPATEKKTHNFVVKFFKALAKPFNEGIAFIKAMHQEHVVTPKQKVRDATKTRALELLDAEFKGNTEQFTPRDKQILKKYLSSDNNNAGIAILRELTKPHPFTKNSQDLIDIVFTSLPKEECLDLTKDALIAQLPLEKLETLFRDNSMASKLVVALHKKLIPNPEKVLKEITIKEYNLENENHQELLLNDCTKILHRLVDLTNDPKFPKEIKEFTTVWKNAVVDKAKKEGFEKDASALFTPQNFMLRFFNPIIFNLAAENEKNPEKQKAYLSLAKALQNVTNRITESKKEPKYQFLANALKVEKNELFALMDQLSHNLTKL